MTQSRAPSDGSPTIGEDRQRAESPTGDRGAIEYPFPVPSGGDVDVGAGGAEQFAYHDAAVKGRFADAAERDMAKWQRRQRQVTRVNEKARQPNYEAGRCVVIGCGKPSRAATSKGLDRRYCRRHADHYSRHGDPLKGTYEGKVLARYRRKALRWLRDHADDAYAANAMLRVEGLMRRAGVHVEAFRLNGLSPADKANAHWARLREAGIAPENIVATWLAVEMVIACDPQPVTKREFRRVQAAKAVHRLASGTHKKWEYPVAVQIHEKPKVRVVELHKYPQSRGLVLRRIGEQLEGAVELLAERYMAGQKIEVRPLERDAYAPNI